MSRIVSLCSFRDKENIDFDTAEDTKATVQLDVFEDNKAEIFQAVK